MSVTTRDASILIVDDEPLLADTLATIFQRAGYTAAAVYSGEEALASIAARQPSLVITDVIMPGIDGIALAKTIQTSNPNCRVLLFSGNAETQDLLDAAQQEGQKFEVLAKPIPPPQILAKVASILDHECPSQT
jgi:CheY-like chemotaxis protein